MCWSDRRKDDGLFYLGLIGWMVPRNALELRETWVLWVLWDRDQETAESTGLVGLA